MSTAFPLLLIFVCISSEMQQGIKNGCLTWIETILVAGDNTKIKSTLFSTMQPYLKH